MLVPVLERVPELELVLVPVREQVPELELVLGRTSQSQQFDRTCTEERYVEDLRGE